jgi:hypothetical protein
VQHLGQSRLVKRDPTVCECGDLLLVAVDAEDLMPKNGHADRVRGAQVSGA